MKAAASLETEYGRALVEVLSRIQKTLKGSNPNVFPIRMYIAGGAALHLITGERVTEDVDAVFSKRVLLNDDIQVSYRDADGHARILYLDRNYNDSLGLMHGDAYENSSQVEIPGIDASLIEVRVLSPVDLAVSKLARFNDQDRIDMELLAKRGLIDGSSLRQRAEEALEGYVGDVQPVRGSIDLAARLIDAIRSGKAG